MELLVVAVFLYQLLVGAALHDASFVDHANLVGVADCRQTVGNGYRGAGLHKPFQRVLNKPLALGIERRGCLVEYKDGRILKKYTGYRDTLLLTAGKSGPTFSYLRIKTVWQSLDKIKQIRISCCFNYFFHSGITFTVCDVISYRAVKKVHILLHDTDIRTQGLLCYVPYVRSVDLNTSISHIIKSGEQGAEGRLAAARRAYYSHRFTRINMKIYMRKYSFFILIGKTHVFIVDNTLYILKCSRIRFIHYLRHRLNNFRKTFKSRKPLLQLLGKFDKNIYRINEYIYVQSIYGKIFSRYLTLCNKKPARDKYGHKHHSFEEIITRMEKSHLLIISLFGIKEGNVALIELSLLDLFTYK